MLKKVKLTSTLAAVVLFFLPWLDIRCSEKSFATQTGIQLVYGGATPTNSKDSALNQSNPESEDSFGIAPLVGVALIAVYAAAICAVFAIFAGKAWADRLSEILPAFALTLLLIQLMVGFPVTKKLSESMQEDAEQSRVENDDGFGELGAAMGEAMLSQIQVKKMPAFWAELAALGFPTLILLNGLIDRYKKD